MCFRHDTPRAIQKLIKTVHNEFHYGSASTFIELLDTTEDTVVAWRQHMMDNEMTKEGCPKTGKYIYESLCADFVAKHFTTFKSWATMASAALSRGRWTRLVYGQLLNPGWNPTATS
eukprot:7969376-Pyramimonas_sp.AAC.1